MGAVTLQQAFSWLRMGSCCRWPHAYSKVNKFRFWQKSMPFPVISQDFINKNVYLQGLELMKLASNVGDLSLPLLKPLRRQCQKFPLGRENTLCTRGTCCRADKNFCKAKTWRQAKHIKPCYMCTVLITEDNQWVWQKHLYGTGQLGPSTSQSLWL